MLNIARLQCVRVGKGARAFQYHLQLESTDNEHPILVTNRMFTPGRASRQLQVRALGHMGQWCARGLLFIVRCITMHLTCRAFLVCGAESLYSALHKKKLQ